MVQRVGFIGLGNIGQHLAASVVRAGIEVVVHDLDRGKASDLLERGAAWADSPREVAEATATVVTCLPSPQAVPAVMTGDHGVVAGMSSGSTWIEMSTNDRDEVHALAEFVGRQGGVCLEAPVTGGVHKAAKGEMTVLVGGPHEAYLEHLDLFTAVGNKVIYVGGLGDATVMKVITNMLAFIHLVSAGEALMLAKRGGIDLASRFHRVLVLEGVA